MHKATKWWSLCGAALLLTAGGGYVLWLGSAPPPAAAPARPALGLKATRGGHYRVAMEPIDGNLAVGQTQGWVLRVFDSRGTALTKCDTSFDGWMPEHGHGLPTEPRTTRELEPGVYLIEGVRLSMPGLWQLSMTVAGCGPRDVATYDVSI